MTAATPQVQERYGKNSFGWSLLMARRLVEAGVNLVQVNLGNNEGWDTHGNAFPHLKDKLFPPTDRAVSALLDDVLDLDPGERGAEDARGLEHRAGEPDRVGEVVGADELHHERLAGRVVDHLREAAGGARRIGRRR